jgi:hypothetical protein
VGFCAGDDGYDGGVSRREELEALVREDPYDDGRWLVLEDCLIETEDPRAAVVRFERERGAGDVEGPIVDPGVPLGPRDDELAPRLSARWRAGYLVDAELDATKSPDDLVAALVAAPAASLLRSLAVKLDHAPRVEPMLAAIRESPCAASLRSLTIGAAWPNVDAAPTVDIDDLPLRRLFALGRSTRVALGTARAQLHSLSLVPANATDLDALLGDDFASLRDLGLGLLRPQLADPDALEPVLSGACVPQLRQLQLHLAAPAIVRAVLARLANSALLPRLRDLVLGSVRVPPASLGRAFAHLDTAAVAPGVVKA